MERRAVYQFKSIIVTKESIKLMLKSSPVDVQLPCACIQLNLEFGMTAFIVKLRNKLDFLTFTSSFMICTL